MKFVYSVFILSILFLAGCKQELNTSVSKYVDTPVVYGILNINETYPTGPNVHYIRIQKGYLLEGNAYLAAGIEDSIYYPNVLKVQLYSGDGYYSYNLSRIDGATVGLNKDTGIFANTPNYLYTFNGNLGLDSNTTWNLLVVNSNTGDTITTASTTLVNGMGFYYPNYNNNEPTYLALSNVGQNEPAVSWNVGNNSGVYDLTVTFICNEFLISTNAFVQSDTLNIPVFSSYIPSTVSNNTATYSLPASIITSYLTSHLSNNPLVYRQFVGMTFTIAGGGTILLNYFNTQQAQSGLTSSNALPVYSNITGGVGLLSSREYQSISGVLLNNSALDSLACWSSTSFLNFKNSQGNVCY